jgi:hypothetical protein
MDTNCFFPKGFRNAMQKAVTRRVGLETAS